MATELEQFVEANKQRLGEVNASNPQLYSAISMALDYLNKQYFGGTTELKVDIPQPTPVTPVQTIQTASVERLFTDEELANHILDNVWTALDFKEIKIELTSNIQKQNFLNLVKLLLGRKDRYSTLGNGNYFLTDKDLVVYNSDDETSFNKSPYTLLYYNQIFENLLKAQQSGKLRSVWDSVYAYSSKDYATPIDYNFLQKAIYSNRRSKDMKLEIARAFGEIKSISRAVATNWDEVEKNYGVTTADLIYQYQLNDEVFKIFEDKGFDFFYVNQYSDLDVKEWISELIFPQFEEPLKFDDIKEKLLEWYRNQINKPTAQPNTSTPQTSTIPNAKFKVGDKVKIIDKGKTYTTFTRMFKKMRFANQIKNDEGSNGDVGTIFDVDIDDKGRILYGVLVELGATRKYQILIGEAGLELIQPITSTPQTSTIPNAKFKIGDKVKIINKDESYPQFKALFKTMGFANQVKNDEAQNGDVGTIFAVEKITISEIVYGVLVELGATRKYQTLISEEGIELFQPTPLSASKFEVGDWVRLNINDSVTGVAKGTIGLVTSFDSDNDPYIEWQDKNYSNANGVYLSTRFELVLQKPRPLFNIGDVVMWKETISNFLVKQGAVGEIYGFGVSDGFITAKVDWLDTKTNKKFVNGQGNGGYYEGRFKLLLSDKQMEDIAQETASKIVTKTIQPEETTIVTTSEDKDEEDFEDLADELENLDF